MSFGIGNRRRIASVIALISLVSLVGCNQPNVPGEQGSSMPSSQTGPAPVTAASPNVIQADPKWFSCEHTSQCSVQQGPCEEPQAVNNAFTKPFIAYRDSMNQMIDCHTNPKKSIASSSFCDKEQRCSLKP